MNDDKLNVKLVKEFLNFLMISFTIVSILAACNYQVKLIVKVHTLIMDLIRIEDDVRSQIWDTIGILEHFQMLSDFLNILFCA